MASFLAATLRSLAGIPSTPWALEVFRPRSCLYTASALTGWNLYIFSLLVDIILGTSCNFFARVAPTDVKKLLKAFATSSGSLVSAPSAVRTLCVTVVAFLGNILLRLDHTQQTCLRWANVGKRWHWSGNVVVGVTTLAQRCSDDGWRRHMMTLIQRRVTMLAQRCSDDGWRRHSTTLSQRRVTMLAQHCSDDGWRRHSTTLSQRRVTMLAQRCSRDAKPTSGDDVGSTLFRWRLATSPDDAKPTSGDDVGSTLFRRRLATSQYDTKPTSGDDVGSTLFRWRLATSPDDATPTSNPFPATWPRDLAANKVV